MQDDFSDSHWANDLVRWDIFCRVVDNFGDIGVTFRLARQLVAEHGLSVRLWLDDMSSLHALWPEASADAAQQWVGGVEVRRWDDPLAQVEPAQVVIEAFACGLPDSYLNAMALLEAKPVWINLEYLSAEEWVDECHGMASRHPRLPLTQYFFFPGFSRASGGLLREQALLSDRRQFQASRAMQQVFWQGLGIAPAGNELKISLFGYANIAVNGLLEKWAGGERRMLVVVPENRLLRNIEQAVGRELRVGDTVEHGSLRLVVLPFLRQDQYDRLLWACDINFVRGEDSFVRAQWAGVPLIWQIYLQQEEAHLIKLDAFLDRYRGNMPLDASLAVLQFWHGWNVQDLSGEAWDAYVEQLPALRQHAAAWADGLAQSASLAEQLISFCKNRV